MSPIILKYLPFCTSQPPVFLQCDKRLLAPILNPFLSRPISGSIVSWNTHHTNLVFLLKSRCLQFFFSSVCLQEVVLLGGSFGNLVSIWPGVYDTFQYFILEHVCVFRVCIRAVICLTSQFEEKQFLRVLFALCVSCVVQSKGVCSVCAFKKKKIRGGGGNEIQCWMNYGVCIVPYCVVFRVRKWMEVMCKRCKNKNRKTGVCFRRSVRFCMNCLRLPCRTDTSEIHHFFPFAFNKNMSPS